MPHHIHKGPVCGITYHDPECFDKNFGIETDCILIEAGKYRGKYMCLHHREGEIREISAIMSGRSFPKSAKGAKTKEDLG